MEYTLQTKETTIAVDLTLGQAGDPAGHMTATLGKIMEKTGQDPVPSDQTHYGPVCYSRVSDHQVQLVVNGQQTTAWVESMADGKTIILDGEYFFIQDADALAQNQSRKKGEAQGPGKVTPPMPAVVISVPVQPGDQVKKGDVVVVLSAMKMETSLTAPHGGTVTRVKIKPGDKVMPGDILIDIEENDTGEHKTAKPI